MCYVDYLLEKNYDAAILGEFLARRYSRHEDSGNIPLEAAYLTMAAYGRAYSAPHNPTPDADAMHVIEICNFIKETWPQCDKSDEVLLTLGRAYVHQRQYARAAESYSMVAENAPQRQTARMAAGQAYWKAFLQAKKLPESERLPEDTISDYKKRAEELLNKAIADAEAGLTEDQQPSDELILAKFTAAQIANESGDFDRAIQFLETGPHAVLSATFLSLLPYETPPQSDLRATCIANC
jgi:tetratricopeptide (TPR) repeat protein